MSNDWFSTTASTYSDGYYMKRPLYKLRGEDNVGPPQKKPVEPDINYEEIEKELKKIAAEEEEDKQKHLPVFDPEDLDI